MGRFGIEFSDEKNQPFRILKKTHYSTIFHSSAKKQEDGKFQKFLAWTSYYVMVFVALCVFNQPANAASNIIGANKDHNLLAVELISKSQNWQLRSSALLVLN